ncbi:class I SAM-dependent methyltransferase [Pullulanibacillus sp. KACC 23026]|uniref:class I SAM-dependent DNA methyltransferase n=1 Tax=Pullulanibacillus sp. KACC 23026 TaxID=3028315 RepID=UPI0023B10593|nr:class I SAM-dependent methyltransferase [Pullulanibacillus sp. KACC 23026]WEG14207.1 class I SAM-dependent methyltransferase [Pullulanibacillus sp. KACC 23026]
MSKSYEQFSSLYDELMAEAPYDRWLSLVETFFAPAEEMELLELGAGTGTLALSLAQKGYVMTVSDYSSEMLAIAEQKFRKIGFDEHIPFYLLDMSDFDLETEYDGVLIFCDALNYLPDQEAVKQTFINAYRHLKPGGYLLFDVHSTAKMDFFLTHETFGSSDEELSYLWECFPGEAAHSVIHDLTFFVQEDEGLYRRVEETHEQRTYPIEVYRSLLHEAGFTDIEIIGDFQSEAPLDESERWIFVSKKK